MNVTWIRLVGIGCVASALIVACGDDSSSDGSSGGGSGGVGANDGAGGHPGGADSGSGGRDGTGAKAGSGGVGGLGGASGDGGAGGSPSGGSGGDSGDGGTGGAGPEVPECPSGFAWDDEGEQCADVDECATNNGGCGASAEWRCIDRAGAAPECREIRCVVGVALGDSVAVRLDQAASDGCDVEFAAGTHHLNATVRATFVGTERAPFELRPAAGAQVRIVQDSEISDGLTFDDSSHLIVRGLDVSGGQRLIRFTGATSHVRVVDCSLHDAEGSALSFNTLNSSYADISISGNEVRGLASAGIYVGCSDSTCTVDGVTIERNYVHDITYQAGVSAGVFVRAGSADVILRDNVVHDVQGAGLLVYGARPESPTLVERNLLFGALENGIVVVAHARVQNNIVLGASGWTSGIEQALYDVDPGWNVDRDVDIVNNTVVTGGGAALRLGYLGGTLIANNALYAPGGAAVALSGVTGGGWLATSNVRVGSLPANFEGAFSIGSLDADFVSANATGSLPADVFPSPGSALVGVAALTYRPALDFNGSERGAALDVGAYAFSPEGNPGAALAASLKPEP